MVDRGIANDIAKPRKMSTMTLSIGTPMTCQDSENVDHGNCNDMPSLGMSTMHVHAHANDMSRLAKCLEPCMPMTCQARKVDHDIHGTPE
ncbi:hypothetical protein DVH24_015814 [Malus domestica]|uniref:Uncharacterized protein n=1 Tax=Malus domestica TaxID=3750 RepID=A0A498HMR6_MALDO|nr:hypothetical protein DVH24_015814 [Malus domestica]